MELQNAACPAPFYAQQIKMSWLYDRVKRLKHCFKPVIRAKLLRWRLWLTAVFLLHLVATPAAAQDDYRQQAQDLLQQMTVEERIGQLFLVTFRGDIATVDSDIADLIRNYHIGGVMLRADHDNITGYGSPENAPFQTAELVNDLQRLALLGLSSASVDTPEAPGLEVGTPVPTQTPQPSETAVPLLIATSHDGDGYPHSQIFNGLTPIPSNMAIGATWRPEFAQRVGNVVGQELSALGVNLLFGPSLDVLENPTAAGSNRLGTQSFGGDPYWVGLMGQAYTSGVHQGSQQRIAVVPKHFPGYGSSDRELHVEIPTVRKSLEQLRHIELAPFFAVTGGAPGQLGTVDALLTTHIRYQGFQGNIRATTNPVSFDQQALTTLMAQPPLAQWRQNGGVIISDALGVRAVQRFYDDTGTEFPHRQVAKDAFLAGNDLLYLADFASGDGNYAAHLTNVKDSITWFWERYRTDPSFQQQVDQSVLRILQLKLRLYGGDFAPENVLVDLNTIPERIGQSQATMFDLAQNSITLVSPAVSDLTERMPQPPSLNDRIVVFTDVRQAQQCSACPPQPLIGRTAIEDRMLAIFGPDASGQIQPNQIESFSLDNLRAFLDAGPGPIAPPLPITTTAVTVTPLPEGTILPDEIEETATPAPTATPSPAFLVQEALEDADWIIFGMLDNRPGATALSDFLAQRPDLTRGKQIVVLAYNAPYFLDTTEISQMTAFFAMYSKTRPFIDASVRALFQEIPLPGASPVNIDGIRYNLFTQTQPDPNQVIELYVVDENGAPLPVNNEPLDVSVGDTLRMQTGVIRDRNGNPVPDDTVVRFIQRDRVQGLVNIIEEVPTRGGVAQLGYVLEARTEAGQFQITAEAGPAIISLEVNISVGASADAAQVSISTPIPQPTATPTATPTTTPTPSATPSATPEATGTPAAIAANPNEPTLLITLQEIRTLAAMSMGLALISGAGLLLRRRSGDISHHFGLVLWGIVGGLLVYNYLALELPGTAVFANLGSWAALLATLLGGVLGLGIFRLRHRNR